MKVLQNNGCSGDCCPGVAQQSHTARGGGGGRAGGRGWGLGDCVGVGGKRDYRGKGQHARKIINTPYNKKPAV